ncbi:YqaJ viral recombinase family protein [Leucobacter allii]|uniref:YqaJ viral recombinase family protein n=1 Tax=Leucobacter allii TaxID=2932247 RepID=A0ABY4FPC0_9MICO|nr:YqaJ viral recombinase family protein [Leucobacter allii]UOQ58125.1 YqaJ viral recombinase family protein [Leucobacter allii]
MSATFMEPALADLEARAGASDQDREAWLAERRQGVTATELAKIMTASNRQVAIQDLVRQKRDGDSFTGNAYTEWGKEREPVIAADLAGYGVVPESRVFHAAGNSRHLASPDGLSVDFDGGIVLDEIKTSGKPLPKGSPALDAAGYEWQMQWCCYVIGATGCWLNVEQRLGNPGDFRPGPRSREWFPRDEGMIAELVEVADMVLAAMDSDVAPALNEEVDTHAVNYLRALDEEKQWAALKKSSYAALIDLGISQESPLARVTITPARPGTETVEEVVDLEAAQAAHPKEFAQLQRAIKRVAKLQAAWDELADAHTKSVAVVTKGTAARATVTAGKQTKEQKA